MSEPRDRPAASSFHGDREPEVSVRTVRLEELLAILRRHVRLVVGVVLATVAAAGVVAYVTGPAYRAVAVIRMSDPRRALTGAVVLAPARADESVSVPLWSQAELLTSRAVAGAVVDSMPALRMVATRDLPLSSLGEVAVPAAAGPVSLQIAFGQDSFIVRGTSGRWSAPYGSAVECRGIRFAVLHRPDASTARLRVLSREAAITRLLARLRVKPRLNTDIVDVTYSAPDPNVAQHVLNQVVDIFKSASAEDAQQQSTRRREFLESQLKVNDSLLADARQAVTAFRQRAGTYGSREALARQQELSTTEEEEARLTERVDNAQKVADELRVEYQKAKIAEAVTVGQVEIVDHAALPAKPAGIGLPEQIALGLLLGLMLGSAGAFLADRLGGTIAQRVQVEQLGMSVIGVITHLDRNAKGNGATSPDAVVEAFRGLRLSLVNEYDPASGPIVVTVTSPGSGDGKSFVSSNLALAFSYAKQRTLLVDADLRRGALHRVLNLRRQPGLTDFLAGDVARAPVLQKTSHPCLDFIASGTRRRDAPELLGSGAMADLVTSLRSTYDVIVLDTAPLGAGVDALALAKLAGNLLMVLRLGRTDRELAEAKLEILRRLPLRLLGAVLNDVRDESEYRAYAYYMDGYGLTNEPLFRPLAGGKQGASSHAGR